MPWDVLGTARTASVSWLILPPSLPPSLPQTDSDNNLHFVEAPALAPPEVTYDQSDMLKYEQVSPGLRPIPVPVFCIHLPWPLF